MYALAVLRRGIRLARRVEALARHSEIRKPVRLVGYGFLVRNRRLAVAVERLGTACAYEGRMLLRSMIEIMINYAWIRLRQKRSRARRFVAYHPLELLHVQASMHGSMPAHDFALARRNLERRRRHVRHLFRFRDRKGKMQWARSWAKVGSVEARLQEVKSVETPAQPDQFLYALYSWISSAVHGGPHSLMEVLRPREGSLIASRQPERDSGAQFTAAAVTLVYTIHAAVEDLALTAAVGRDAEAYSAAVQGLRNNRKNRTRAP